MEDAANSCPVSVRGGTPELSTPSSKQAAPLLSPLCSDPKAWALDLITPGGTRLRFADRSPSCSPRFASPSGISSSEGCEEGRRDLSGCWLMARDSVHSADDLSEAVPDQAPPLEGMEGLQTSFDAGGADALACRTVSESGCVEAEACGGNLGRESCQVNVRGAFDSDPVADTWVPAYPASWEGVEVGAGSAEPCSRSTRVGEEAEEIPLLDASASLVDAKQDSVPSVGHFDDQISGDGLHQPSPEKFSLDRVTSGLCDAAAAADLTAFLDELEGGCSHETLPAYGHNAAAQMQAPCEPFPGRREEEGTLQDVLDVLVGTVSCDSLADSLVDVRYTTPFSATSSGNSHSVRGASPASDWEGEGASLGCDGVPLTWALSASDLGVLQEEYATGGADTRMIGEDTELLDDSWIDCLLDSDALGLYDGATAETVQESVEGGSEGKALPVAEAAFVRDSVREAVRGVVGLARRETGLALVGGAGEAPALAPALRAAVVRLALDAARTKALKTNKASVRQAVLRASAALESASCRQEEGQQSPEEGAAAVRRALVGRLTTWRQALGIPGAHGSQTLDTSSGAPGVSCGSATLLSASQRTAHLRRAVALARGKQWPPSAASLEQTRGREAQGPAAVQGPASEEGALKGAAGEMGEPRPVLLPAPAPASGIGPGPVSGTPPVPPVPAPAPSLRDRIKSLLGEAARPQRSLSPPAYGNAAPSRTFPSSSGGVSLSGAVLPSGARGPQVPLSCTGSSIAAPMSASAIPTPRGVEGSQEKGGREQEQRRSVKSAVSFLTRKRGFPGGGGLYAGGHTSGTPAAAGEGGAAAGAHKAGRQGAEASPGSAARRAQLLAAAAQSATGAHRGQKQAAAGGRAASAVTALAAAVRNPAPACTSSLAQKTLLAQNRASESNGTGGSLPARLALLARDVQRRQPLL